MIRFWIRDGGESLRLFARRGSPPIEPHASIGTSHEDLKQRAVRGGVAKLTAQAVNFIVRIGSFVVLARLLQPADFGLVSMVTPITGALSLLKEFGLSTASVQRATIDDSQMSTLFWINLLVGVILGFITLGIAPIVASFYHEPRLVTITTVLAAAFVFNGAGVQHSAFLQRRLRFTTLAAIEILSFAASSLIAVSMALKGQGYWALVAWSVSLPVITTFLAWQCAGWSPGRPRLRTGMRSMMRFGGTVTVNGLVIYSAYNLDKVLLGRYWGAEMTGIYGRAYQLVNLPMESLNIAAGAVALPILSRVQDDNVRLRSYFLKMYGLTLALTIPMVTAAAFFARDLVLLMLGDKWSDAIPVFRILTPTILVFALINPTGWLLTALGLVGRSLKLALAIAAFVTVGCVVGLPYGPQGVALGFSAAMMLWVIPHLLWCFYGTVISYRDVLNTISRPMLAGVVSLLPALAITLYFGTATLSLARLLLGGTALVLTYLWMLLFVMKQKPVYINLLRSLTGRSADQMVAP